MSTDDLTHAVTEPSSAESAATLSEETLSEILARARSRALIHALKACESPIELDDLAARTAAREYGSAAGDSVADDRRDRVLDSLYREHLPRFESAGLVDLVRDDGIFAVPDAERLDELV